MKVINIVTLQKVLRRAIGRRQETHGVRLDKETADDLMQVLDSFPANEQVTEENPLIGKQVIVWEYIDVGAGKWTGRLIAITDTYIILSDHTIAVRRGMYIEPYTQARWDKQ